MTAQSAFEIVAEPTRRRILDLLLTGERPVGDLVTVLGMSQPGVSRHLRVLRDAGLVTARTDAQRRLYSVNPAPLAELDAWLAPYRRLWAQRLDQLEARLNDMTDVPDDR
jgi:DNA-binding transcriptional ArsR family regulator